MPSYLRFILLYCKPESKRIAFLFSLRILSLFLTVSIPLIYSSLLVELSNISFGKTVFSFLILVICSLLSSLINYSIKRLDAITSKNINYSTRRKIVDAILCLPNHRNSYSQGKLYAIINNDVKSIYTAFSLFVTSIFAILKIIAISVVVYIICPKLLLVFLMPYPLIITIHVFFHPKLKNTAQAVIEHNDTYLDLIKNTVGNVRNVISENASLKIQSLINSSANEGRNLATKQALFQINVTNLVNLVNQIGHLLLLGIGILLVHSADITFGNFVSFVSYSKALSSAIDLLVNMSSTIQPLLASIDRVITLDKEGTVYLSEESSKDTTDSINSIILSHVSLSLGNKCILADVNLSFEKGTIIGFSGSNGSGKTSLMNLIMQNIVPSTGTILINNCDYLSYNYFDLRTKFEYIGCGKNLYYTSLLDNVLLSSACTEDQLFHICQTIGIHNDIMNLPDNYQTKISTSWGLSTGQAQKIQIAKGLLKNAEVLIFDESMANLDDSSKKHLYSYLKKIATEKIVFIISHNELDYCICDKVYWIENGKIKLVRA